MRRGRAVFVMLTIAAASTTSPVATGASSNWKVAITKNEMDDREVFHLSVDGSPPYAGARRHDAPTLGLRCSAKRAELILVTRTIVDPSDNRIRLRVDAGKPEIAIGTEGTNGESLFFSRPGYWVTRLAAGKVVKVEMTPFRYSPSVTVFPLAGLAGFAAPIKKHCGIEIKKAT
jgi:hypothetical protein